MSVLTFDRLREKGDSKKAHSF